MTYDLNALPAENEESPKPNAPKNGRDKKSKKDISTDGSAVVLNTFFLRHVGFIVLALVCVGVGLWQRDVVLEYLGWSLVPVGGWVLAFVYLLFARTSWVVSRLRPAASSLLICLGGAAVLGIFDAPLGAISGATMGGVLGEYLAREPFDWDRYNIVLWQQAQGWARAMALFGSGVALQFPTGSAAGTKITVVGLLMLTSSAIGFMSSSVTAIASATTRLKHSTPSVGQDSNLLDDGDGDSEIDDQEFVPGEADGRSRIAVDTAASYLHSGAGPPIQSNAGPFTDPDPLNRVVIGLGQTIYAKPTTDSIRAEVQPDLDEEQLHVATLDQSRGIPCHGESVMLSDVAITDQGEMEVSIHRGFNGMAVEEDELKSLESLMRLDDEDGGLTDVETEYEMEMEPLDDPAPFGKATRIEAAIRDFPWYLPPIDFMSEPPGGGVTASEIESTSRLIEETLEQHAVDVTVDQVRVGPTITMYGLKPGWKEASVNSKASAQRVRVDTILNREKDIALALKCANIRFESVVPGSSVVGIEVPNADPTPVNLRSVLDTSEWKDFIGSAALPVPLGMGSGGDPVMADFAKMPHTLVAGATGSGKSVCMNTIIAGLLLCRTPLEVRMVMIDPKRVELTPYQGVPHLYTPVVVEPGRAVAVLKALTKEMMDRFATLEFAGVKNIGAYNNRAEAKMPYLLVLVDELADLMLTASNEVEQLLVRLAQLGRATGVHLVVATQRPSVDVVTGLIKANFPSRISFSVMSQVDSRTILDSNGAEKLLGKGDMLYKPIDLSKPVRVQGAYVDEREVESVVDYWVRAGSPPLPQLDIDFDSYEAIPGVPGTGDAGDSLVAAATNLARNQKTLSTSLLQRRLKIGYPRAARLMDELEEAGLVGPGEPGKPRKVLHG